jgi:glycosyltransferase involved in cell wall biosynthesis
VSRASQDRPTVCHVTSVHVPTDSRVLYHECRSLAGRYRTILACRDDGPARTIEGVEILPLPRAKGRLARFAGGIGLAIAAEATGADLYHFHDPELLSPMLALARRMGRPVVYDVHEYYPDAMMQKTWIPRPLRPLAAARANAAERRSAPRMAAIVTADAALTRRFEALNPLVVQLDNYPPLALFGTPSAAPVPGPPTLVYVGSVSEVRGFFDMVDVLRRVRSEVPDARLVVYGRPTEEVAPRLAETLRGLPEGALVIAGAVEYGRVPEILREAHIGLSLLRPHPKYEKNISMKVFDYMAASLPYVASDFAPLREKTRGVGGELVPAGDPASAAEAVLRLLRDGQAARRVGLEGRALVEAELDWERVEPRLFALYERLLGT